MNIDDILDNSSGNSDGLFITGETHNFLKETAKWAKFLAIAGFVMMGLAVLAMLFSGFMLMDRGGMPATGGGIISLIYLSFFAIYAFPLLYMYHFAINMNKALAENDHAYLQDSFEKLKSLFKFTGILMIIVLGCSLFTMIGGALFFMF